MPLFGIEGGTLVSMEKTNFNLEKELQSLVEKNLAVVFNSRFVASEFSTGTLHSGRIDTLALSEDNNPVIIEYKKVESSELINQSLFYLYWIRDHRGDFEMAVRRRLGDGVEVDWSDVRVICLAPNYKKYDLHAVQVMGANIELWRYQLFENRVLHLEEVFLANKVQAAVAESGKNPIMVEAGKKAALVRATASYTFDEHLDGRSEQIQSLLQSVREAIVTLDDAIEEVPKKFYIAYKTSQNIVCVEPQAKGVKLFLKLGAEDVNDPPPSYRDVTDIGHYGTGDTEFTLTSEGDLEAVKPFIELAYNKLGG